MKARLWRAALLAVLLVCAAAYPLQYRLVSQTGNLGFLSDSVIANSPGVTRHVTTVRPGSPAWNAGIRPGDALPLAHVDRASRIALDYVLPGQTATYVVQRGSREFTVRLTASRGVPGGHGSAVNVTGTIRAAVVYTLLLFALVIVLRAWNSPYGPIIATLLTAIVADTTADNIPWVAAIANPAGAALLGSNAGIDDACSVLMMSLPVLLAGRIIGWSSFAFRCAGAGIAAVAAIVLLYFPVEAYFRHTGEAPAYMELLNNWLLNVVPFFAGALALIVAYRTAQPESKQRLRWIFWGCFPYLMGIAAVNIPAIAYSEGAPALTIALRAITLALPVALMYGVLLRRVVDIGFVLNRVAVYGALSIALVAIFVLLEYALSHVLLESGRAESLGIQLGVALAIGFSARYLHKVTDSFVDRMLFAKRHADETALRRFATEAEAYRGVEALLDRTLEIVQQHTEARGAAVYFMEEPCARAVRASGPEFPLALDVDDALLVKLRSWNEPVDTHEAASRFPDGMLFAMTARGRLLGALACETKRDNSAFDPDERASLSAVARGVGLALDGITSREDGAIGSLQISIAALANAVAAVSEKLDTVLGDGLSRMT